MGGRNLGNTPATWYVAGRGRAVIELPNLPEIGVVIALLAVIVLPDLIRRVTKARAGKGSS